MATQSRFTTITDIAKKVGVSPSVVSFVLNGSSGKAKRYCSDELRKKIMATAKELNYIQSNVASNLKGRPRNLMAVLIPQFFNEFFTQMALEIEVELEKAGYILSICNTFDDPKREAVILKRMFEQRVDGIFMVPAPNSEEFTLNALKLGIPIVVMDRYFDTVKEGYHSVLTQNYQSAEAATMEVVNAGLKHIAFIDWKSGFGGLELRKQAFENVVTSHNLDPNCCRSYEGPLNEETGYELTKQALIENPNLQAIVFANNIHARLGVKCLIEKGLEPGRDISVAIVGAPKWVQTGLNNFTCVDLNGRGIGKRAAHIMLSIIKNELPENKFIHEYIPCTLNVGNSIIKK